MSDIIGGDQTPTPEQLRKLKSMLPMLKRQAREQRERLGSKRKLQIENMVDPKICGICATAYDRYKLPKDQKDAGFCPGCIKHLSSGGAAFVTISGRYCLLNPNNLAEMFSAMKEVAKHGTPDEIKAAEILLSSPGSVAHCPEPFMDFLKAKFKTN